MSANIHKAFIKLVQLGIGKSEDANILKNGISWPDIKMLAEEQGLFAIVLDGIEKVQQNCPIPLDLKLQWIGETLQNYEGRYTVYEKAIGEMAGFYNMHGYKMMVLKGYACSLDWPKPEHRPCGDIDIWLFGRQKEADDTLRQAQGPGFEVDTSEHHHTTFFWGDFMVENHYNFINTHRHYSHRGLEKTFKELGQDDSYYVELKGTSTSSATSAGSTTEKVYLPSPNLHALFLVRHALNHFASIGINLRQVLDWAFFVEKHTNEIDWQWLTSVLEKCHMTDFYNCLNAICVENLGFEARIFKGVQFNPTLKEKVFADLLSPEYNVELGIKNMLKRWKANRWKHKLCFKENAWTAFCYGVWSHLLKPKTI